MWIFVCKGRRPNLKKPFNLQTHMRLLTLGWLTSMLTVASQACRSWKTRLPIRICWTFGGSRRCSRTSPTRSCSSEGTFVMIWISVLGTGDGRFLKDGAPARWRVCLVSTWRSFAMGKRFATQVRCYSLCGVLMSRPSITVLTFGVIRIRLTGSSLYRTQSIGGISWSSRVGKDIRGVRGSLGGIACWCSWNCLAWETTSTLRYIAVGIKNRGVHPEFRLRFLSYFADYFRMWSTKVWLHLGRIEEVVIELTTLGALLWTVYQWSVNELASDDMTCVRSEDAVLIRVSQGVVPNLFETGIFLVLRHMHSNPILALLAIVRLADIRRVIIGIQGFLSDYKPLRFIFLPLVLGVTRVCVDAAEVSKGGQDKTRSVYHETFADCGMSHHFAEWIWHLFLENDDDYTKYPVLEEQDRVTC